VRPPGSRSPYSVRSTAAMLSRTLPYRSVK
jgi:hypothetical protein